MEPSEPKGKQDPGEGSPQDSMLRFPVFHPRMEILPPSQQALWPLLRPLAEMGFVLYGGTAIAIRLGHRESVDFDFFTERIFHHPALMAALPFASDAMVLQEDRNTLTLSVTVPDYPGRPVKVSFFDGLTMGRIGLPERTDDGVILAASLPDLLANKLKVIHEREEKKDYLDIHGLLSAGLSLSEALAGGSALFGKAFQARVALTAMTYFKGGDLDELTPEVKQHLIRAAAFVEALPSSPPVTPVLGVGA